MRRSEASARRAAAGSGRASVGASVRAPWRIIAVALVKSVGAPMRAALLSPNCVLTVTLPA
jgi:hypothetical protein